MEIVQKGTVKAKAVRELRRFMVMFLYLWVLFALFSLHRSFVLAQHDIDYRAQGFAAINALMLAKVMLVAEDMRLGQRFQERPLIYPILYQSFVFSIIFICFHFAERILVGAWDGKTIAESLPNLGGRSFKEIASIGAILFVTLIPFFAFKETSRVIGAEELQMLFFGRRAAPANAARADLEPRGSSALRRPAKNAPAKNA